MSMLLQAGVAVAGSVGAVARFSSDLAIRRLARPDYPWATLVINIVGSFILGVVTGAVVFGALDQAWRVVVGIGFCGGYTTFSTASVEAVALLRERRWLAALAAAAGTLVATMLAAGLGLWIGAAAS